MPNTVEIIVVGRNMAGPAFAEAEAGAKGLGGVVLGMSAVAGAALVAVGVEATKMGAKFDSEMTRLNTQAHVSKDQLGELSKGVLDLAGKVGQNPDSLAEALYHVESNFSSMGISSQKALGMVKVAAEGASVGNANLVDVTNALTAAVASGIPGVQNLDQAMGILNATVGAGDMTMQDLANAFGSGMVATVKGFGLSITDVGAALATFGDNNIRGALAGNQLRMSVQALAKPVQGGTAELKKLGLSSDQLAKDMQSGGLLKALEDLKGHMDAAGISADQQGQVITEAFGRKAGSGLNILIGQLDRVKSKYPELQKGAGDFGDAWKTTSDTTQQKWKDLKASWDALMIHLGEALAPAAKKVLDGLNNMMSALQSPKAKDELNKAGKALQDFAHYAEPVVKEMAKSWKELVDELLPKLGKFWDKYGPTIKNLLKDIGKAIPASLIDPLKVSVHLMELIIDILNGDWKKAFKDAGKIVKDLLDMTLNLVKGVLSALKDLFMLLLKLLESLWNAIKSGASSAWGFVKQVFTDMVNWLKGLPGLVASAVAGIFSPIVSAAQWAYGRVSSIMNSIAEASSRARGQAQAAAGVGASVPSLAGHAYGGIIGAATGGVRGNLVMVGEQGPELVRLPLGSQVTPSSGVNSMLAGAASGAVHLQLEWVGGNGGDEFMTWLRRNIRVRAGSGSNSVQQALGQSF